MAFPITNYTRIWVRGRIIDLAKAAREETSYGVTGPVQFVPSPNVLVDQGTDQVIDTKPFVVFPDAQDGYFQIQLPATNDPDINPTGWTYHVFEPTGRDYHIVVPYDTPALTTVGDPLVGEQVIELSDVVPNPEGNPGTVQVLAGIAGRGVSSLAVDGSSHLIVTYSDSTTSDAGLVPTGLDAEGVRDTMGTALVGTSPITVTVNDGSDTITVATTLTQYTDALARAASQRVVAMTDGATITPNANTTDVGKVTMAGNRTIAAPSGTPVAGQRLILRLKQDATGTRVPTWNSVYRFAGGTTPTLTTTANKTDYLGFIYNADDTKWDCVAVKLNF